MGISIYPDGHEEAKPDNGSYFSHDEIRQMIGAGFDSRVTARQSPLLA